MVSNKRGDKGYKEQGQYKPLSGGEGHGVNDQQAGCKLAKSAGGQIFHNYRLEN
ncbi:MAG: hypothetical protein WCD31_09810 [Gillisia sp.]